MYACMYALGPLTFRLPSFFCDIRYQGGVVTTHPLDLRYPACDPGLQYTVFFSSMSSIRCCTEIAFPVTWLSDNVRKPEVHVSSVA
jgi:hypothetical protein